MQPYHDSCVKKSLSNLKVARSFLCCYLPDDIQTDLNLDTLAVVKGSFVDKNLRQSHTDILFSVRLIDFPHDYIYILVEHQRKSEKMMPVRLRKYRADIMLHHMNVCRAASPPIVYTLILYNGVIKYQHQVEYYNIFDKPDLAKKIMQRPSQLIDLTQLSEEALLQHEDHGIVTMILKDRHLSDFFKFFKKVIPYLQKLEKNGSEDVVVALINYLISVHEVEDFVRLELFIDRYFNKSVMEDFMTGREYLISQGHKLGRAEGLAEGRVEEREEIVHHMAAAGFGLEKIAKYTGIPFLDVKRYLETAN